MRRSAGERPRLSDAARVLVGLVVTGVLAGCGGPSTAPTATATATAPSMHRFGEAVPAGDVTITVTEPVWVSAPKDPVTGCRARPRAVFRVVFRITNTSQRPWDTGNLLTGAGSDGRPACNVWTARDLKEEPHVILPSRTGTVAREFGVQDRSKPLRVLVDGPTQLWWTNDPAALRPAGR